SPDRPPPRAHESEIRRPGRTLRCVNAVLMIVVVLLAGLALVAGVTGILALLGRLPGNGYLGVRTPETRRSPEAWRLAHPAAGLPRCGRCAGARSARTGTDRGLDRGPRRRRRPPRRPRPVQRRRDRRRPRRRRVAGHPGRRRAGLLLRRGLRRSRRTGRGLRPALPRRRPGRSVRRLRRDRRLRVLRPEGHVRDGDQYALNACG